MQLLSGSIVMRQRPPVNVSSWVTVRSLWGMSWAKRAVSSWMVGHHRVFNVDIDLLLSPIGGCDKAVETRQVQEETHQANAAGPDFDTHQMEGNHDAV